MKLFNRLILLLLVIVSGCKKEENISPSSANDNLKAPSVLTINSQPQIIAKIDGKDYWLTTEKENEKEYKGSSKLTLKDENKVHHFFLGGISKNTSPYESIIVSIGRVTTDTTVNRISKSEFDSIFKEGAYSYSDATISIIYRDENGTTWETAGGIQANSNFSIIKSIPTASGIKVYMKFNCTVYNSENKSVSKKITETSLVTDFYWF